MPTVTEKLVTPPPVREYLDWLAQYPDMTPDALAEVEHTLNLSYHHGGKYAWQRVVGEEREFLFAGNAEETADWADAQEDGAILTMAISYVPPWKQTKREWGIRE